MTRLNTSQHVSWQPILENPIPYYSCFRSLVYREDSRWGSPLGRDTPTSSSSSSGSCSTLGVVLSRAAQLEGRSPCCKQAKVRSQGPTWKEGICEVFSSEKCYHEMQQLFSFLFSQLFHESFSKYFLGDLLLRTLF